ncbi:MAG TPA: Uma2 family endonuclease [Acetobacteraceae bacterium]|nr:Uma2 family endonuclease [Acetobacteraceae bacterium]
MTVAEFLAWDAPGSHRWQLVDGEPQAMAPASRTHNGILGELDRLIGNHLLAQGGPCSVVPTPGVVPRVCADSNYRIPDLAVTCSDYQEEEYDLTDPVLLVELLSPSNRAETWTNVWAYTTMPSVREILVVHSIRVDAELLRRNPDGSWPAQPVTIDDGEIELASIGFRISLAALYRTTRLARH